MSKNYLGLTGLTKVFTLIKGLFDGLASVAKTGSYNDLGDKPTIPTNTNQLTNGAGFITSSGSITGSSGSCTGNAATATKATQDADGNDIRNKYVNVYNSNGVGTSSAVTVDDLAKQGSSVAMIYAATDNPTGTTQWVHVWSQAWTKGVNTSWVSQIALGVGAGKNMWYRTNSGTAVGRGWVRVVDTNDNPIVNITRSGTTFTAKRASGSTFTFTQQDTNTTYSANNGVGLSGTTFYNSGVRGVSQVIGNPSSSGYLRFNVNGSNTDIRVDWANRAGQLINGTKATISVQGTALKADFVLQSDYNVVLYKNGGAVWQSGTSSRRFKHNIQSMTEERAKKILQIRPVTFDWNDGQPVTTQKCDNAGVIAEEVSQIIPDVVVFEQYDNDPNTRIERRVEYERFTPYLIKMVQMQQKQIDALTKRVEELEAKV